MDKEKFVKWLKEEVKGCQSRSEIEREHAMNELLVKIERGYFDKLPTTNTKQMKQ